MQSSLTDAEIVALVRNGQKQQMRILVDRHLPSLLGFLRFIRVPEDMVEDMIQETFLRAFKYLDRYDPGRSFTTWLTVIGRNVFYTELQKRGRQAPEPPLADASPPSVDEMVIDRATARELLDSLDSDSRFLVELRVFRDLSFAKIAETTGETEISVRVRFHRLMKKLRLGAEGGKGHEQ